MKMNFAMPPTAFGEPGAKQSQDDKPRQLTEPVRTASVDYGLWSHLSLHSRYGSGLTVTWPLLAELYPAQSIPARPFGLGLRFDGALLVARASKRRFAARSFKPTPRSDRSPAHSRSDYNQPGAAG
jgi:hypothetical protein